MGDLEISGNSSDSGGGKEVIREGWSEFEYNLLESNLQNTNTEIYGYSFPIMPAVLENFEKSVFDENHQVE